MPGVTCPAVPCGLMREPCAFVTVEGVDSEPGTVELIDLVALETVGNLHVPPQAGGVDVLPLERH